MKRVTGLLDSGVASRTNAIDWAQIDGLRIKRLETDSRRIKRGDTFVAYPGDRSDGRKFIAQALYRGARSVLWERRGFSWRNAWRVPNLGISGLRARSGLIASHIYGEPSAKLLMVGTTGTNGKTTCSQWIAHSLNRLGLPSGVIGTLGAGFVSRLKPIANTTPEAVGLHTRLANFVRRGAAAVSMEVSSIGLDQQRVAGIRFDIALLTNLTRDHLDYHGSMRAYRTAKARLFECESLKCAVVNLDDRFGVQLATQLKKRRRRVLGYGFGTEAMRRGMRVSGSDVAADQHGVRFEVRTPWGAGSICSGALGRFNASNLLATLTVLLASGVRLPDAIRVVNALQPIRGRMQKLGGGRRPLVVIDYAHTPDALEKVLRALRELMTGEGSLVCVFGCGGDRDRGKRPLMGRIAARLADVLVITSDNPRGENPRAIIDEIVAGIDRVAVLEIDRRRAIRLAIDKARRGDVILIAGKGHETYQEVGGVRRAFDDVKIARAALNRFAA